MEKERNASSSESFKSGVQNTVLCTTTYMRRCQKRHPHMYRVRYIQLPEPRDRPQSKPFQSSRLRKSSPRQRTILSPSRFCHSTARATHCTYHPCSRRNKGTRTLHSNRNLANTCRDRYTFVDNTRQAPCHNRHPNNHPSTRRSRRLMFPYTTRALSTLRSRT